MRMFLGLAAALIWTNLALAGPEEDAVRHLLHATFDKPENRLVVDPVVVADGYAIAGWTQGEMGGRALLRNKGGRWRLILCAGDAIKSEDALRLAGLSAAAARALSQELNAAERQVTVERLALFARFEGQVRMDADGNHPPVTHHKH